MKKTILLAALLLPLPALALTETVDGITWTYTVTDGKASIYKGSFSPALPSSTTGAVTIPSKLGNYPVTSLGNSSFWNCSGLTSVTIPEGVTSIEDYAFRGCSGLASIKIPNSVTKIGSCAFLVCTGLTSIEIPGGVTSIGSSAFSGCSGLTSVTIPNGVTTIENHAFDNCSGLTSITIPDSVTSIGYKAFHGCSGLTSITIPNNVTSIEDSAFAGCSGLTSITIPDSVTSVGTAAFASCSELTSITIPDGVTSVGERVFYNCKKLNTVFLPESLQGTTGSWGLPEGCRVFSGPDYVTVRLGRIPKAWIFERAPAAFAAANEDWEAAAQAMAANGENKVWECYVAGLDPANATNRFLVSLDFDETGAPHLAWLPDLGAERFYYAEGKSSLSDRWGAVKDGSRFFRIRVALPIDGDYLYAAAIPLVDSETGERFRPDASEAAGMNAIEISDDLLRSGIKVKCPCATWGGETAFIAIPTEYMDKIAWFASDGTIPADPPPFAAEGERYSLTINQKEYTAILWYVEYYGPSTWMLKLKN